MADRRNSPLATWAPRFAELPPHRLSIVELPFAGQLNLRVTGGHPIAPRPNSVSSQDGVSVLWLGPDEWLAYGEPAALTSLTNELRAAGGLAAAVDVSAQRTTLAISGPAARDILSHGCALDLHSSVFGPGRCAQTMLAHAQVILWHHHTPDERHGTPDEHHHTPGQGHTPDKDPTLGEYRVLVRTSFAGYLAEWLLDASVELRG
jgi:sarcosine oxidase subunit gamma